MPALTQAERDVWAEIALGRLNKEIARARECAVGTVVSHVKALRRKLGIHSRTKLALAWWRAAGLTPCALVPNQDALVRAALGAKEVVPRDANRQRPHERAPIQSGMSVSLGCRPLPSQQ